MKSTVVSLLRIEAPHFTAAVELDAQGIVLRAAPILHYMRGWTDHKVRMYCSRKLWKVEDVPLPEPTHVTAPLTPKVPNEQ